MNQRALKWAGLTLVIYLGITAGGLAVAHGRPAWFVHFGRAGNFLPLARHDFGPQVPVPLRDGADGQTFWVLARDPLLRHPEIITEAFDRPVYRSQRIGYPLLASPGGLLGAQGLAWALIVVNLAAVAVGGYAAAAIAARLGGPGRASLAWALNPAVAVAVILDTSDVVAIAAVLCCMWLLLEKRWAPALAAAVAAVLAKEIMVLPLAAVAVTRPPLLGLSGRRRLALVLGPVAAAGSWGLYERWRLGWGSTKIEEITWPFAGYVDAYRRGWQPNHDWGNAAVAVVLLLAGAAVVVAWARRRHDLLLSAALPFALLTPLLSSQVVDLSTNSSRAFAPALTFGALALMVHQRADEREEGASPIGPAPSF